jgi:Sulfotransferase domain
MNAFRMTDFKVDYIGIGAAKAGTSWVNQMLGAHPDICTAEPKEVHFFHDAIHNTAPIHQGNFKKGLSWYKRFFQHCTEGQVKGEITPKYLIDPVVPERIRNMFPEVKLILCLRSPVERATSHYYFTKYFLKTEKRPIAQAIREEPEYILNGLYFRHLRRYLEHFPMSAIHLVWFEDIAGDPDKVLEGLYTFLCVDPGFKPPGMHGKSNAAKKVKSKRVRELIAMGERKLTEMGLSGFVRFLKRMKVNKAIAFFNARNIKYEKMSEADRTWLIAQFREDIIALQTFTGRDLSTWLK